MKRQLIVPAIALGIIGASALGVMGAKAQTSTSSQTLVQKIAQKFNLKESDVQAVFDEDRSVHQAEMQQKVNDKLDRAVKDGKLTDAQKQAIQMKLQELQKNREANEDRVKDMSEADRKAAMQKERADLEQWAKDNNIDMQYLRSAIKGGPGRHGMGIKGGR